VTRRIQDTRRCRLFRGRESLGGLAQCHPAGEHFEHMAHCDSHTANRRFTTAHVRFDRDTIDLHAPIFIRTSKERNLISITRFGPACAEMLRVLPDASFTRENQKKVL
jgi:hypothetical protein